MFTSPSRPISPYMGFPHTLSPPPQKKPITFPRSFLDFPIGGDVTGSHLEVFSTLAYLPTTSLGDSLSANPTLKKKKNASIWEPTLDQKTAAPPPLTRSLCGIERNKWPTPPLSVAHLFDEDRSTLPPMSIDKWNTMGCTTPERQRWVWMKIRDFCNVLAAVSQQQDYFKKSRPCQFAEGLSPEQSTESYWWVTNERNFSSLKRWELKIIKYIYTCPSLKRAAQIPWSRKRNFLTPF